MICYLESGKPKARMVLDAFAAGCGGAVAENAKALLPGPAVFYGVTPNTLHLWRQVQEERREFYYIDNGYFGAGSGEGAFFRATRNAMQHDGSGAADHDRFSRFDIPIEPWKRAGEYVLICRQSDWWYERHGMAAAAWLEGVVSAIKAASDRPVVMRPKGSSTPLRADLARAWCVVAHSSNALVEAVLAGVPIFATAPCAALRMGSADLSRIERPRYSDGRAQWAWNLAANQWSLAEFRDGAAWRMLNRG